MRGHQALGGGLWLGSSPSTTGFLRTIETAAWEALFVIVTAPSAVALAARPIRRPTSTVPPATADAPVFA
ncbi:MAG: hypothetical protein LH632_14995 [Rhodoferax sp.]|nr:hypothetical protein [Rhodoferax sp.]